MPFPGGKSGDDYRERERIQRKQRRWKARLARMSRLERYALLDAVAQLAPPATEGPVRKEHHV